MVLVTGIFLLLSSCNDLNHSSSEPNNEPREIRTDHMFLQRAFPKGKVKETALQEAKEWKEKHLKGAKFSERSGNEIASLVGPTNAGGRVVDVEIPFDKPDTYYIAAASGGIFKTEDGGATWVAIFDDQGMLTMGDLSISKNNSNLIWVGTGEADAGHAHSGNGVYKSLDGGVTWESKGLSDVGTVGKVLIDPNDDNTIFVAAMGPVYRSSEDKGIYRSSDGGETWSKILYIDPLTGGIDIAMHPSNSNILYASMWHRELSEQIGIYGGPSSGLYRSTDGGDTWEKLSSGLSSSASISKIKVEIAPSNPNVVYALYINAQGNVEGFYYSNNGGNDWVERNSSQLPSVGFNEYFGDIYVDPMDENIVYNMGFQVYKTIDGGQSWSHVFVGVHFDQQAFCFNPQIPGHIVIGNDGGLYKSNDSGVTSEKIDNLPITQFYRLYVNGNNNNTIYGGCQDNGSWRSVTSGGIDNWEKINEADGFQALAASTDGSVFYSSTQGGQFYKQGSFIGYNNVTPIIGFDERNNWDTPVTFDPNNTESIYYGTNKIHKTVNGADSWEVISPDLSNGPGSGSRPFGTLTTIDVSSLDNEIIYAGLDDGNVWVSENGGTDWTKISDDLPVRWVTKVFADRENSNKVYVTLSGYKYGEDNGNIYVSEDRGQSWVAIGANLPDIPINDVVKNLEGIIIIGTDAGLFISKDEGDSWEPLGINLPNVIVTDLQISNDDSTLYSATYGRSMYKFDISSIPVTVTDTTDIVTDTTDIITDTTVTAIATVVEKLMTIGPNPTMDYTTITLSEPANQVVTVLYDSFGKVVMENTFENVETFDLIVSHLTSGTYFLNIKTDNTNYTRKLMVL